MFVVCQFGSLLDENAGYKFDNIGLNAMANTDKAGRDRRVGTTFNTREHGREELLWTEGIRVWWHVNLEFSLQQHETQNNNKK